MGERRRWLSLPTVPKFNEPRAGQSSFWPNEAKKLNDFNIYIIIV
jgi:hypothetical protein